MLVSWTIDSSHTEQGIVNIYINGTPVRTVMQGFNAAVILGYNFIP